MARKITIWKETTQRPISLIGEAAGVCWGANTSDYFKNYNRGLDCLFSNHGRTLEFPQIYMTIEGFSAKMMRDLYAHIGGLPTRLQASTRYLDYKEFEYVEPHTIKTPEDKEIYNECMGQIAEAISKLEDNGVPREDAANLLPLGYVTKVVIRTNLRHLIDMSHQRMCSRAYWEYREFMQELIKALNEYGAKYTWDLLDSDDNTVFAINEWERITSNYFKPKCEITGYCTEKKSCGRKNKR